VEKDPVEKEKMEQLGKSFADSHFGDVMVVGGGISGIQAALDLSNLPSLSNVTGIPT